MMVKKQSCDLCSQEEHDCSFLITFIIHWVELLSLVDRHTGGQTDRWSDTQAVRHTGGQTHRRSDTQVVRQTGGQTHRWSDRQSDRRSDTQVVRHTGGQTDRRSDI